MSRFVRPSKYRHVYGQKSKFLYENAKVSGSAWDTDLVTAGGKYIAVNWQVSGGGAFAILPSFSPAHLPEPANFPLKLPDLLPLARGHTAPVLDTAWSPFDDNVVVSSGEDGKIFIWNVEDSIFDGWNEDGWEPVDLAPSGKLNAGGRKVGQVTFNPAAENLLASASGDYLVRVWDIQNGQEDAAITLTGHNDSIQSIAWNAVGTVLATTCRDRKLRLFDPRAGTAPVRVTDGHGGIKGSRVVWLGDRDRIATTGFSRMSDRQLSLWETGGLKNLSTESLDSSAGIIIPFFAEGNDVLFLAGKGDGNIRYYEFDNDQFYFLNAYQTSDPQRGIGFIPRRALDVQNHEIARAFKLSTNSIEPLSFVVPRKAEGFQSDIYPPANSIEPALSASEWLAGKVARPNLIDLETRAATTNKAPVASPAVPSTPVARTPPKSATPPPKEEPKPAAPKEEPKPAASKEELKPAAPKAVPVRAPSPPAPAPEPEVSAKSLEIEQPDEPSDDEEPAPAPTKAKSPTTSGAATPAFTATKTPTTTSNGAPVTPPTDELLIQLLSSKATAPTRGSPLSAGYDLYAAADIVLPPRGRDLVSTQIAIAVPAGTYGRIAPRSGLAAKHGIDVGAGVVDADYRGEVKVVLFNHNETEFKINAGDRVAQLILEKCHMAPLRTVDSLEATSRGAGGFGSTGGYRA